MHGCLERTPEFLREGARIDPYGRSFRLEVERMVRSEQARVIKSGLRAAMRLLKRAVAAFYCGLAVSARAFIWFWNVPVLGGTEPERR